MKRPVAVLLVLVAFLAVLVWRSQLFTVARPGDGPAVLSLLPDSTRTATRVDVVLPAVPVGMRRVRGGEGVTLVHYWAMWEHDGRAQAVALDSLQRLEELAGLRVVVVCFDPFPSVARYVGRARLRLGVLIDGERQLSAALPCPSIPFTYVLDHRGRVAVAQPGEVDWLAPATRTALRVLLEQARRGAFTGRASSLQQAGSSQQVAVPAPAPWVLAAPNETAPAGSGRRGRMGSGRSITI